MASRTATKPMNRSLIHHISHASRTAGRVSMKLRGRNEGEVQPEKAVYPILNHCCALQNKNAPGLTQARRVDAKSPMYYLGVGVAGAGGVAGGGRVAGGGVARLGGLIGAGFGGRTRSRPAPGATGSFGFNGREFPGCVGSIGRMPFVNGVTGLICGWAGLANGGTRFVNCGARFVNCGIRFVNCGTRFVNCGAKPPGGPGAN